MDVVFRVCNGEREEIPKTCHPVLADIIRQTQAQEPSERPTIEHIFDELSSFLSALTASTTSISSSTDNIIPTSPKATEELTSGTKYDAWDYVTDQAKIKHDNENRHHYEEFE